MIEKYALRDEPDKTMFVFKSRVGTQVYGHIIRNRTETSPAKLVFETAKFESIDDLKAEYPALDKPIE
ncbi:hypothetical protein [Paenibacillus cremeus]|uniref:Uncharacterized protein n=1 Tax=Paenibacillus cremeus TaxID=2163881 RepID=A0A559JEQ7_9BACL|nr:hypothetical protein [Paenibacillus cremeus]TVX98372.1 hypothetical protein FPZ49_34590 [Paenibacillus cremeus]